MLVYAQITVYLKRDVTVYCSEREVPQREKYLEA